MTHPIQLRVFVACTNDLSSERNAVAEAVEDLAAMMEPLKIGVKVLDWRKVVPNLGRPQQVIFDQLKATEWDLFIGILWHRFGTPSGALGSKSKGHVSGTKEEFQTAHKLWKKHRRPRIMIYRCTRPIPPEKLDIQQYKQVKQFFDDFETRGATPGLFHSFGSIRDLTKQIRRHVGHFLLEQTQMQGAKVSDELRKGLETDKVFHLPRRESFFGRQRHMDSALRALAPEERGWGLVIDGIGGIGKTALAIEAAYRCREHKLFENFVFVSAKRQHLDSDGIRREPIDVIDLNYFLDATARIFHRERIADMPSGRKQEALRELLRETRTLLVFDNLETLSKEVQEQAATFLRTLPPGCKAIITSRRRGGEGAVWLKLDDLQWEDASQIIEHEKSRDAWLSHQLLRVGEERWQEVFDLTGRSPLALLWCLGRIRTRKWSFDDALGALRKGNLTEGDFQEFMFGDNHRSLDETQRVVLCSLAFFDKGATFESLGEISRLDRKALMAVLERLTAVSLVIEELGPEDRFRLNQLTKSYVHKKLMDGAPTRTDFGERFSQYWLDYSRRYAAAGRDSYRTFDRVDLEWQNVWAAVEWLWSACFAEGKVMNKALAGTLNEFAEALGTYLVSRGKWDERITLSGRAYQTESYLANWEGAFWRAYDVAWIHFQRGELDPAQLWSAKCRRTVALSVNASKNLAFAERLDGFYAWACGHHRQASVLLESALRKTNDLALDDEMLRITNDLITLHCEKEEIAQARTRHKIALALAAKSVSREEQCRSHLAAANLALVEKDANEAASQLARARDLALDLQRLDLKGKVFAALAGLEEMNGNFDQALHLAKESLACFGALKHRFTKNAEELVNRLLSRLGNAN